MITAIMPPGRLGAWHPVPLGLLTLLLLGARTVVAGPHPLANPPGDSQAILTNSHFQQVGPHIYAVGKVRLDKEHRTVSFPATVNMQDGIVEYFLVSTQEKCMKACSEPRRTYHIHLAMLLLNAKGAPKDKLTENYAKPVPGDPILIQCSRGPSRTRKPKSRPESLVLDKAAKGPMARGPWTYRAARESSTARSSRNATAPSWPRLATSTRWSTIPAQGGKTTRIWTVNKKVCPPVGTPVEVTLQLLPAENAKPRE